MMGDAQVGFELHSNWFNDLTEPICTSRCGALRKSPGTLRGNGRAILLLSVCVCVWVTNQFPRPLSFHGRALVV